MVYTILLVIVLAGSVFEVFYYPNNRKISVQCYFLSSILFVCIGGLTNVNGLDVEAYRDIFSYPITIEDIIGLKQFEPFFLLLCKFFPSYELFILGFMVINLILMSKTFAKTSPFSCLSLYIYIAVYYLLGPMGQLRQALAISILIYAWRYLNDKKFLIYVILASLFHFSAMICFMIYFIPNKLYQWKFYVGLLFIALIFFIPTQYLFINVLTVSIESMGYFIGGKLGIYLNEDHTQISLPFLIIKLFLFLLLLWKRSDLEKNYALFPKLFNIYIVSIFLYLFLSFSGSIGGRLSLYYSITEVILIPYLFKSLKTNHIKFVVYPVFIILYAYQFYSLLIDYSFVFLPYKSFIL